METNSTSKLIEITKNKGIVFERGDQVLFRKYSYYQVINAYKNLFIIDADTIDEIKNNISAGKKLLLYRKSFQINNNIPDNKLYETICSKICKKYGISASTLFDQEEKIRLIKYHHHIYGPNTFYGDFVRLYKFEHELRIMLLKYTLIIEEGVKNIFISYLNDKNAAANYLVNMDNYDTNSLKSMTFDTMKLMISKYDNQKSKPVKRKRDQHLTVPYWILINELAMNQTYYAIANLKQSDSYLIFLRCVNFFTNLNFSEENRGKTSSQIDYEKKMVNGFKTLLCYLGEFRNMLAHNQPIYSYNVQEYDINLNDKFKYELPSTKPNVYDKNGNLISHTQQQINIMGSLMHSLQKYFGSDNFNSNNSTKLDLSKIIYILYKILSHIDPNTNFYSELVNIYSKYNIIVNNSKYDIDVEALKKLKSKISDMQKYDISFEDLIEKIRNKKPYVLSLRTKERELKKIVREILNLSDSVKISEVKSKYKNFPCIRRYYEFTGIDLNFFTNIL